MLAMAPDILIDLARRRALKLAGATLGGLAAGWLGGCGATAPNTASADAPLSLPPLDNAALLDDLERRSFAYFWDTTDPATSLVPDRWPTPSFASVAAVGFALTAYPIGVARGWVTREQAAARTLARCCACNPCRARPARMWWMCTGVPVTSESARLVRNTCPPHSPCAPSISSMAYPFTHTTCLSVCTMSTRSACAAMTASMDLYAPGVSSSTSSS